MYTECHMTIITSNSALEGKCIPSPNYKGIEEEAVSPLEYAIMKCLNLIGQCEGSKSLRATVHGLYMWSPPSKLQAAFATTTLFMDTLKK